MKKIFLLIPILLIGLLLVFFKSPLSILNDRMVADDVLVTVEKPEYDFAFSYLSGGSALSLIEPPVPASASDGLRSVSIMMETESYNDFYQDEDSDPPPTITIFVIEENKGESELSRQERLLEWAKKNPQYTSYALKTSEVAEQKIDGVPTQTYNVAGEYLSRVHLVSYSGNLYAFVGQYEVEGDAMFKAFDELIDQVVFY
tara:strand:- start:221 stop:823 length:603 start_codon:yes stop_codon:yes gene_type:complete